MGVNPTINLSDKDTSEPYSAYPNGGSFYQSYMKLRSPLVPPAQTLS